MTDIVLGQTVWVFNENRRVYNKDANGRSVGAPIYREKWIETTITGETTRSWIVSKDIKIPPGGCKVSFRPPSYGSEKEKDKVTVLNVPPSRVDKDKE